MPKSSVKRRRRPFVGEIFHRREATWPLSELGRLLPPKPSYQKLWNWCRRGRSHPYNHRRLVRMESIEEAGGLASSVEAYWRFIEALNGE